MSEIQINIIHTLIVLVAMFGGFVIGNMRNRPPTKRVMRVEGVTEKQQREAFSHGPQHPIIKATLAILQEYRDAAVVAASSPGIPDKETAWCLGRMTACEDVMAEISEQVKVATK